MAKRTKTTDTAARPLLTDHQCRVFLKDMREFGYMVDFEEVRAIADELAQGKMRNADPVATIMAKQIDEAAEMVKALQKGRHK